MRPRRTVLGTGLAVLLAAVALSGCEKNTGETGSDADRADQQSSAIATDPKDSQGPAPDVPGAKRGGVLRLITEEDFEHIDPQRTYTVAAMSVEQLLVRTLTQFREDGKGKLTLIGDLAETPGKDVNGDCRTWEYTLKKGVRYEDGSEVKAADVAYGIARSFEESLDGGATYVQEWLADSPDFTAVYKGPYSSGGQQVPGLTVTGDYGLTFEFKNPHCDLPFALALPTSAPLPPAKDTRSEYDRRIFSSGPYKIKEYVKGTRMVLERNPNWDPKTDALRHNYLDGVTVEFGPDDTAQTERVLAASGDDAAAIAWDGVPQSLVNQVLGGDRSIKDRTIDKANPFVWVLSINNDRIRDVKVRQAIGCALDKQGVLTTQGGDAAGKLTNTLQADTTIGWQDYPDPTGCGPTGNPEKARELLGGQQPKLVFLSRNTSYGQQTAPVVKESLEKAGFQVVTKYIERAEHNPTVKTRGNPYDIYVTNWAADWPSGASTIPVLYDGRKLGAPGSKGNNNSSAFNAEDVSAEIAKAERLPAGEAGDDWARIDRMIQEKYYPVVPMYQSKTLDVMGPKVGGVFLSDNIGTEVLYNAFIK